jgi:mRNA-degrading endonuclease toxin of MazEF toxin-antitoxin module
VSNNSRNRLLSDVIAISLTTTARDLPTWVKLSAADPLTGHANAECIEQPGKDEVGEYLGALSPHLCGKSTRPWPSRSPSPDNVRARLADRTTCGAR